MTTTSNFDTDFEECLPDMYEEFSVTAEYQDTDGTVLVPECSVIMRFDLREFVESMDIQGKTATLIVRLSEVAAKPFRDQKFVTDGRTFSVDEVVRSDTLEHEMLVIEL